jgi:dual specificity phosphatase 12
VTKIWERLFLGNLKDAEQLANSNHFRIASVVSLCTEEIRTKADRIEYLHIPIADSRLIPAPKFEEVMTAMANAVQRGNLLMHCLAGMSRSPIMIAAWLHRCGYASIDKALAEISELRDIDPSPVLLRSVKEHLTK